VLRRCEPEPGKKRRIRSHQTPRYRVFEELVIDKDKQDAISRAAGGELVVMMRPARLQSWLTRRKRSVPLGYWLRGLPSPVAAWG